MSPLSRPELLVFSRGHLCQHERQQEAGEDYSVCECGGRVSIMGERERVCTICLASMHMSDNALHNVIHTHVHVSLTYYYLYELMY